MSNRGAQTLVPKRRFPVFQGQTAWSCPTLRDISTRITKKVGEKLLETVSITAGQGFVTQIEKFGRDISGQQYKNYVELNRGDFSYNKGNSKTFPQGCIYPLTEFEKVAAPNAFISFRLNHGHIGRFFKGYFDSNFHGRQLARYLTSGARNDGLLNVSPDDFFSIVLPTPSEEEQRKIADCLSSIESLIKAEAEKLEELKAHKKGLMQNLFPVEGEAVPKFRFPEFQGDGEWPEVELKAVASRVSNKNKYEAVKRVLTNSAADGVVDQREYFEKDIANQGNLSGYSIVEEGDYVYNPRISTIAPVGPISKNKIAQGVMSPLYTVFRFNNEYNDFYEQFFKSTHWYKYLRDVSNSGARHDRMSISTAVFDKMPLPAPSLEEQQKIADCLSSIESLIKAEAEKLEELKAHKKGLIQRLFPAPEEVDV